MRCDPFLERFLALELWNVVTRAFCSWRHCFPTSSLKPANCGRRAYLSPQPPQSLRNQLKATFFIPQLLNSIFTDLATVADSKSSFPPHQMLFHSGPLQFGFTSARALQAMCTELEMSVRPEDHAVRTMLGLSKQRNLKDCNPMLFCQLQRGAGSPFYPGELERHHSS